MERKCETLKDLTNAYAEIRNEWGSYIWCRGQEDASWGLQPSVYREFGERVGAEMNALMHFRNHAYAVRPNCPEFGDCLGWLMLMQHFGLPTRLLDWSSSLGVAGYFSVFNEERFKVDGAIWLLNPAKMNKMISQRAGNLADIGLVNDEEVVKRASAAFKGLDYSEQVIAISPPQTNERLTQQRGSFTLHCGPSPLQTRPSKETFLAKLVIPAEAKKVIADELSILGVTRTTLFPDLDNMARIIKESIKYSIESGFWDEANAAQGG